MNGLNTSQDTEFEEILYKSTEIWKVMTACCFKNVVFGQTFIAWREIKMKCYRFFLCKGVARPIVKGLWGVIFCINVWKSIMDYNGSSKFESARQKFEPCIILHCGNCITFLHEFRQIIIRNLFTHSTQTDVTLRTNFLKVHRLVIIWWVCCMKYYFVQYELQMVVVWNFKHKCNSKAFRKCFTLDRKTMSLA